MYTETPSNEKSYVMRAGLVLLVILSIYFATKTVSEIKNYNFIGGGAPASNVISFDGKGEVSAVPDLATIGFTIRESAKDVQSAQNKVTAKEASVLAFLDKSGIAKKDIKTENYNTSPKYEWRQSVCAPSTDPSVPIYCPSGKSVLVGYEVSESVSVKIHDLTKTGEVTQGIGAVGISEINGPNFSIEKEDQLKAQARKIAIDEAKAKAAVLARDLGVHLVRIVNFTENGNYAMPMYADMAFKNTAGAVSAPAPTLPTGENKITSNVTITYEIR